MKCVSSFLALIALTAEAQLMSRGGTAGYAKEFKQHPSHAALSEEFARAAEKALKVADAQNHDGSGRPTSKVEVRVAMEELYQLHKTTGEWIIAFQIKRYSFDETLQAINPTHYPQNRTLENASNCKQAIEEAIRARRASAIMPDCAVVSSNDDATQSQR